MILCKDTPEIENWVINLLNKDKKTIYSVEGYSVAKNKVTAIFERRRSSLEIDKLSVELIKSELIKDGLDDWVTRFKFASYMGVPFFIIIWKENISKYLLLRVKDVDFNLEIEHLFEEGKVFAEWLKKYKDISVTKGFVESSRLASIDIDLRKHGVPWPGNLDGFIFLDNDFKSIIEFSRTRKTTVKDHDIRKFFGTDCNRWKAFEIMRTHLKIDAYIILWSSSENVVKIQKIKEISDTIYYENENLIDKSELLSFFDIDR